MCVEEAVEKLRARFGFVKLSLKQPGTVVVGGKVRLSAEEAVRVAAHDCSIDDVIAQRAKDLRARLRQAD